MATLKHAPVGGRLSDDGWSVGACSVSGMYSGIRVTSRSCTRGERQRVVLEGIHIAGEFKVYVGYITEEESKVYESYITEGNFCGTWQLHHSSLRSCMVGTSPLGSQVA